MKKVIVGTGLFICGVLALLTSLLRQAIYFASPNRIIGDESQLLFVGGILFFVGIAICIFGLFEDVHIEKKQDVVLPQKECPNCGKEHDMDYPKCPFCKYDYYSN